VPRETFRQLPAAQVGCVTGACLETNLAHSFPKILGKKSAPQLFSSLPEDISKNTWEVSEQRDIQKAVGIHLKKRSIRLYRDEK
jgi:hypothetical protein